MGVILGVRRGPLYPGAISSTSDQRFDDRAAFPPPSLPLSSWTSYRFRVLSQSVALDVGGDVLLLLFREAVLQRSTHCGSHVNDIQHVTKQLINTGSRYIRHKSLSWLQGSSTKTRMKTNTVPSFLIDEQVERGKMINDESKYEGMNISKKFRNNSEFC